MNVVNRGNFARDVVGMRMRMWEHVNLVNCKDEGSSRAISTASTFVLNLMKRIVT